MNPRSLHLSFLVLVLLLSSFQANAGTLSLDEYRRQLRDFAQEVDSLADHPEKAPGVEVSVPDSETVSTAYGDITVSHRDLKESLTAFVRADAQKRKVSLAEMQAYIRALQNQAAEYDRSSNNNVEAKARLRDILARREFRRVQETPSLTQLLLAKIFRWILRLLSKMPFGLGSRFDWFQIFIYGLVAAALVVVLIWTLRRLRRPREEAAGREIMPFVPSSRSWRSWLAQARDLAQQQDWRGAIHLAYWAGISFLEEHGAWRPNRARTPREYLRLLTSRNPQYPALTVLTRKFEVVWYGNRPAAADDFAETLAQLEQLGCR